jgi:hypothetical protein
MKTKKTLGWILIGLGSLFLIGGLFVLIFATVTVDGDIAMNAPLVTPSIWITIADRLMDFTIDLLKVDWTPARMGVFLVMVGLVLEGAGIYALVSKN